jgi:hypothetical protein
LPYGIAKSKGGDTPANDAKLERCVSSLMGKGYDKVSAIRVCKASLQGTTQGPKRKHGS